MRVDLRAVLPPQRLSTTAARPPMPSAAQTKYTAVPRASSVDSRTASGKKVPTPCWT